MDRQDNAVKVDRSQPPRGSGDEGGRGNLSALFERFAAAVTARAGSPAAFCVAISLVVVWAVSGPIFGFSETWQLVINTGTTIITFLMVFLIQQSQNKDSRAVHVKLDELLKLQSNGGDEMIDIEDLTEAQIKHLAQQFKNKDVAH
ncbi:MAG: low affinity iron permease family protein [Burkholderiaceae bacterium]